MKRNTIKKQLKEYVKSQEEVLKHLSGAFERELIKKGFYNKPIIIYKNKDKSKNKLDK